MVFGILLAYTTSLSLQIYVLSKASASILPSKNSVIFNNGPSPSSKVMKSIKLKILGSDKRLSSVLQ